MDVTLHTYENQITATVTLPEGVDAVPGASDYERDEQGEPTAAVFTFVRYTLDGEGEPTGGPVEVDAQACARESALLVQAAQPQQPESTQTVTV